MEPRKGFEPLSLADRRGLVLVRGRLRKYKEEEAFMAITLPPEHERAITQAIQSGAYRSPDEVIERALEVLRSEDQWLSRNKDAINRKIERAIAQLDRGEGIPGDELRGRLGKRKAA
jgi:putative addiction module CopG family antidote